MRRLTECTDGTAGVDDTDGGSVIDGLVVGLDAPAPSIVGSTVGGILSSLVETVEGAAGEVVRSVLSSHELGGDGNEGEG